jgi:DNA-directed RNA polymerase subunit K/omega
MDIDDELELEEGDLGEDLEEEDILRIKDLIEINKEDENEENEENEEKEDDVDNDIKEEILKLQKVSKREKIIDIRTQDYCTLFEKAALINVRTSQIQMNGGATYSKNARDDDSAENKAIAEFNEGLIPLKIIRNIGDGYYVEKE